MQKSKDIKQKIILHKKEMVKELILSAAEELWTKTGDNDFSMNDIAGRAGIAVGTIYNYFEDRENLVDYLLSDRLSKVVQILEDETNTLQEKSFIACFDLILNIFFIDSQSNPIFKFLKMALATQSIPDDKRTEGLTLVSPFFDDLFKRGMKEGILKKYSPREHTLVFLGILHGLRIGDIFDERAMKIVKDCYLSGMKK